MIIALTGHRPEKLALRFGWAGQVKRVLTDYIESREVRPTCIISGMALGFDTLGAQVALDLGIPLMAAIPFEGQEAKWPERDRFEYYRLIDGATSMRVIYPGGYHAAKLTGRNAWMVNNADRMCALWDGSSGGTGNCVRYANKVGRPVDNLWTDFEGAK